VLRERILIDGMPVHILDTAGLRDAVDRVEAEGIKRAHMEIRKADHILYVVDASNHDVQQLNSALQTLPIDAGVTVLMNKYDLISSEPIQILATASREYPVLCISAVNNMGMEGLRQHLKQIAGLTNVESGVFLARRRHLDALRRTNEHLQIAQENLIDRKAGELCAEELRLAQQQLAEITGEFTSDDLLGRIFSSFCIGK
jgi:tRNA modification GTPase